MDQRRKRLRFRASRRGFREIDLILDAYAGQRIAAMSVSDLDDFERLLEAPDQDIYAWILGAPAPAEFDNHVLSELRAVRLAGQT